MGGGGGGGRGVLTNQDVQRIINALPSPGDTVEIANRKLGTLRSLYQAIRDERIKAYAGSANMPQTGATPQGGGKAEDPLGLF